MSNSSWSHSAQQRVPECTHEPAITFLSLNVSVGTASSSVSSLVFDQGMLYDINLPAVPVLHELLTAA